MSSHHQALCYYGNLSSCRIAQRQRFTLLQHSTDTVACLRPVNTINDLLLYLITGPELWRGHLSREGHGDEVCHLLQSSPPLPPAPPKRKGFRRGAGWNEILTPSKGDNGKPFCPPQTKPP
ncbi:hypothetical protein MHYP_G00040160 [Metynnis hypsauchen]